MLKTILNTFAAKVLTTIFLFILVLMTTHTFGAEGRGVISLITASVGIINLINGFVGGSALVYIWPRNKEKNFYKKLLFICFVWGLVTSLITSIILLTFGSFSSEYLIYVIILSFTSSVTFSFSMILVGEEDVDKYNLLLLGQAILNVVIFSIFLFILNYKNINSYLISTVLSNIIILIFAIYFIKKIEPKTKNNKIFKYKYVFNQIFKYGFISQLGNLIQYFNYRLSFFILNYYIGKSIVGKYSIGVQIAESISLISSSIALVQYSKIVNIENEKESLHLTLQLSKISVLITFICMLILVIIPSSFFTFIFGKDFTEIKNIIYILSPGIIFYSFAVIISHYFAGKGLYYLNVIGSILSFIVTVAGNYLFVQKYGYLGAGLTSTTAYFALLLFYIFLFIKKSKFKLKDFLVNYEDISFIKNKLKFSLHT